MARRCDAKHISKSKCSKHHSVRAIFKVASRKNGTPLWREADFWKNLYSRAYFGSSNVQIIHAAMARSTFISQNLEKFIFSCIFWKSRCPKIVRRCGAKHIYGSKGPLFGLQMSKNHTPLWREAHLQFKIHKISSFYSSLRKP